MREIKFRAWDIDCRRFEYFTIGENDDCYGMFRVAADKFGSVVEQFTGLKDKNGKEIYEGDIMSDGNIVRFALDDEVGSCGCCYDAFFGSGFIVTTNVLPECLEVRGNIHENQELLNGGKNERA